MSKTKATFLAAAVFTACTLGLIATRIAWATMGQGLTITPISGPALLEDVTTKSETDDHELEFKTKGVSDVYVAHIRIAPGGNGGWHSHPGASILSVTSGEATIYEAHDPATPHVFSSGSAFVEDAGHVHLVVNEGDTDLELVVVQIVPLGAPRRIDEPAP